MRWLVARLGLGLHRGAPRAAAFFLVGYAVLLIGVPSQLILQPLGAPGTPANLWALGGLLCWVCATVGGLNPVRGLTATRVAVGLLTAAVLAAYANGTASGWYAPPDIRQATDELWTLVPPTVADTTATMIKAADRGLLSFAGWMAVVLVAAEGLRSWRDLELVVSWLAWLGTLLAGVGLLQFVAGVDIARYIQIPGLSANSDFGAVLSRSALNRVSGTAVHPIEFGVVLACLFPLALHHSIHRWGHRGASLPVVLVFVGSTLSVSRSAVLVLAVTLVVLLLGWPARWRLRALMLAPFAVVGLRLAIPGLVGTIVSLFKNVGNDPSVSGRTDDYGVVFSLYGEHPWLGRGLFTFVPRHYRILDDQYLMILVELGAVGLAAVLLLIVTGFANGRRARRRARTARSRHLGLVLSASILGGAVGMVTFDAWGFPMAAGLSFLLVGLAGAAAQLAVEQRPREVLAVPSARPEAVR
ncbi:MULTISPECIES: O-antigen ligase family protein [unclassified Nocardioides]|uniref:O-antigen ligase family protein n=1 Tax=unclassified Nocardioides TaxID=2615069 RepID=UPI003014AADB